MRDFENEKISYNHLTSDNNSPYNFVKKNNNTFFNLHFHDNLKNKINHLFKNDQKDDLQTYNKYYIFIKVKKLLYPLPFINNKKPNIFLTYQIVLNNYDFINKHDIFPYLLKKKKNYIINNVQAKTKIYYNDCYPYINNSEILKLPDIKELNDIFNKHCIQTQDGHLDFYLQNLSLQINIYHVVSDKYITPHLNNNYNNNKNIYEQYEGITSSDNIYDNTSEFSTNNNIYNMEYKNYKDKEKNMLIAKAFIPFNLLLKKKKAKVSVPLFFSPFFTKRFNKNEIEVILKYHKNISDYFKYKYMKHTNQKYKKTDGKEHNPNGNNKCNHINDIHNKNNYYNNHHNNNHNINYNCDQKIKNNNINMNQINISNNINTNLNPIDEKNKNEFIDLSNIPLLTLPKIPPPIS